MRTTADVLEKEGAMPSPDELLKGLSNSVLLIASATQDLNMRRQDLFKVAANSLWGSNCLAITLGND